MKKTWLIIGAVVAALAIVVACLGIYLVRTPEYALLKISKDVKDSGVDGLRPHLTQGARETLDTITSIAENKLVGALMGMIGDGGYVSVLKTELQQIQWGLNDIIKGDDKAEVILDFNYDERLVGTIAITMIRESEGWKISGLELPKFDRIDW